ncbi:MAG: glycosyltransferase [Peptococcaceae bacterium]|nr:glycosyltransferase [Peptococcaceae bacterium]
MKKIIVADFIEYNSQTAKLGNYHYCNCFIKDGYEALWVSNAFNYLVYFKDREDYNFKKSISTPTRHKLAPNVYGFAPFATRLYGNYPFSRSPKIIERFTQYVKPDACDSFRRIDFGEVDVLWISNPKAYWLTEVVKYNKLIYRIADDYSRFAEFPNIAPIDELLIRKADGVVISSSTLETHVQQAGKQPLVLSNGVTFEHFSQKDVPVPPEYLGRERKRLVYVGALKYWLDKDLLRQIAAQVDADIYLIGKCETDLASLADCDNIHLLGPRSYELLPGYLQHADVALIPFLKSSITDSISPLKLYEYCSAGVAVVSANLTETAKLNAPIWLANDHEEFISGINHYLSQGYDRKALLEFGRSNAWDVRYAQLKQTFLK